VVNAIFVSEISFPTRIRHKLEATSECYLTYASCVLPTSFPCGPLGLDGNRFTENGDGRGCSGLFKVEGRTGTEYEMSEISMAMGIVIQISS
jgi:hypothetical protein